MVESWEENKAATEEPPRLIVGGGGCFGIVHTVSVFATNKVAIPIGISV